MLSPCTLFILRDQISHANKTPGLKILPCLWDGTKMRTGLLMFGIIGEEFLAKY
jgi:hypothetical protein